MAGGGAKGAYQFGVVLGLSRHGIIFDKIAGTSVGALNGALVAADALDAGEAFWRNLQYSDVYPPRFGWMRRLRPEIYNKLVVALLAINLLFVPLTLRPDPMFGTERYFDRIRYFWLALIGGTVILLLPVFAPREPWIAYAGMACFALSFGHAVLFNRPEKGMLGTRAGGSAIVLVLAGLFAKPLLTLGVLGAAVVCAFCAYKLRSFYLLNSAVLGERAGNLLAGRTIRHTLVVTLGEQKLLFDPDAGYYRTIPLTVAGADMSHVDVDYEPMMKSVWMPHYIEIAGAADSAHNLAALIASASLPFGVATHVQIDGHDFVDGGVCNNISLTPLAGAGDRVIVVHMENGALGIERLMAEQAECIKKCRLAKLPLPPTVRAHNTPATPRQYLDAMRLPADLEIGTVHEIYPSSPIRTRVSLLDLLRFDRTYTNRLIDLGIADGEAAAVSLMG